MSMMPNNGNGCCLYVVNCICKLLLLPVSVVKNSVVSHSAAAGHMGAAIMKAEADRNPVLLFVAAGLLWLLLPMSKFSGGYIYPSILF